MLEFTVDEKYPLPKREEFYHPDGSKRFAYVTFLIISDSYLSGALMFAYGMRAQQTEADLICLVSSNISKRAKDSLRIIYDDVIVMDEVYVPHKKGHERQDRPFLFTRFNAFQLGADGDFGKKYDKILIADADVLPFRNYDHLFTLTAPAGIINEAKDNCMDYTEDGEFIIPDTFYVTNEWKWHDIYNKVCPHGAPIPKEMTDRVIENRDNMGINAALYLFEPSMDLYHEIMNDLKKEEVLDLISSFNWPEMQYITQKFSGSWHNIDLRFAAFNGYPDLSGILGIHYAGLKPWSLKNESIKCFGRFDDFRLWYAAYLHMMEVYPQLGYNAKLKKLQNKITYLIKEDRQYVFYKQYLWNIKGLFAEEFAI